LLVPRSCFVFLSFRFIALPTSTLFPYTTLFRSGVALQEPVAGGARARRRRSPRPLESRAQHSRTRWSRGTPRDRVAGGAAGHARSEERRVGMEGRAAGGQGDD